MAKVSIIIPIYNKQEYLTECLESVINQTLKDIEIICIDEGSTDGSLAIIREYEQKDNRVHVITDSNGGYGKTMNLGIGCANGEYIGVVEADDYVSLEMFDELYQIAVLYNLDMIKSDFYRCTRDGLGEEVRIYEQIDETGKRYGELLNPSQDPSTIRFIMNVKTGIYKLKMIEHYHIRYHETLGASFQDKGFSWQLLIHSERAMILKKAYYLNRCTNLISPEQSKEEIYRINIEYDFIRNLLMEEQEIWDRFKYMYWWEKYFNYMFTLEYIDEKYKKEYLERMQREYRRAMLKNELCQNAFTVTEWKNIQSLIGDKQGFYNYLRNTKIVRIIMLYIPKPIREMLLKVIRWRK